MHYELIKVCGMRDPENIRAVEALGVDCIGLIFWPRSPRYVATPPAYLPTKARRVGVFVDADFDFILNHVSDYGLTAIQLHGHESPADVAALRSALTLHCRQSGLPQSRIIKALSVATASDLFATSDFVPFVDAFLFDKRSPLPGGSGQQFDWSLLSDYSGSRPFILSGGIGPCDVERLSTFCHPKLLGIDLNSRFETAPGLKDVEALRRFIAQLRR